MRRAVWIAMAFCVSAALVAGVVPAVAATSAASPWRVVYRHRFVAGAYSSFAEITPAGAGEMWAVGGYGVAANGLAGAVLRKGGRWHATPVPEPGTLGTIRAVSADSASDAWAVTANGYVIRWNGRQWRIARRLAEPNEGPPGELPTGVLAVSPRNVWVFYPTWRLSSAGKLHGGALHYINGKWEQVTGPGRSIIAASEATPSQLWAIGGSGTHVGLLRYQQQRWRPVSVPGSAGLTFASVKALSNGPVWALAWPSTGTGAGSLMKLSGGHWSSYALPAVQVGGESITTGLASDGHGGVWVAAPASYPDGGYLLHFSDGTWQEFGLAANVNAVSIVAVPHSKVLCAAGDAANYTAGDGTALVWSTGGTC
jgi:hypothetical protein